MKIVIHYLAIAHAINKAVQSVGDYKLTPKVYMRANKHLKMFVGIRYNLNVKASADTSAIVEFGNVDYYLYYDYNNKVYVCERYKM
jgi:hypothetical protein